MINACSLSAQIDKNKQVSQKKTEKREKREKSKQGISLIDEKCFTTKFHHLSSNFDQKGLCCLFPLPISNLSKTKSVSHLIFFIVK